MTIFPTRLRARLVVVALIAVAPAVAALVLVQSSARQRSRDRAIAETQRLARLAAAQQANVFDGARRLLVTLSEFSPPTTRARATGSCRRCSTCTRATTTSP